MFCPSCGRENSEGIRFCVTCGTNLEAVSQALSGSHGDFWTRTDMALDQFTARYAEHVFKDAPASVSKRRVGSWLPDMPSISEHTTERLGEYAPPERRKIEEKD